MIGRMPAQPRPDLSSFTRVPDVPALAHLRRPSVGDSLRSSWTRTRTLLLAALTPLAFWVYAGPTAGRATSEPVWAALTALLALGAAFVASTYAGRGAASGSCALAPLLGLGVAAWLVHQNPTLLGMVFAVAMVGVSAVQRVVRPSC